jgi:hypothetical protein
MSLPSRRGTGGVVNLAGIQILEAAALHLAVGDVGTACGIVTDNALTLGVRIAFGQARDVVEYREADDSNDAQEKARRRKALALA